MTHSVRLAELTWTEVEAALDAGTRTAVVAVGAVEQHGPHLPLETDALVGDELAGRIAAELGDALAAPTVRPGCSGHHMDFPGTLTVPPETLMETVRGYCRSLDGHGFEFVVLVPTHGGNFAPVATVAPDVARELDASVVALTDLDEYMRLLNEGLAEAGVEYDQPVVHAGAAETSMVAATGGDRVRDDREPGHEGPVSTARLFAGGFRAMTANGVLGDPRVATAAAGETILDRVTEAYVERIEAEREAVRDA